MTGARLTLFCLILATLTAAGPIKRDDDRTPATCEVDGRQIYLYNEHGVPSLDDIKTGGDIVDLSTVAIASALVELDAKYITDRIVLNDGATNQKWIEVGCDGQYHSASVELDYGGVKGPRFIANDLTPRHYDVSDQSAWMAVFQYPPLRETTFDQDAITHWPNINFDVLTGELAKYTGARANAKLDRVLEWYWNGGHGNDEGVTILTSDYKDKEVDFKKAIIQPAKKHKLPMIVALDPDATQSALFVKDTMYTLVPTEDDTDWLWLRDVTKPGTWDDVKEGNPRLIARPDLFNQEGLKLTYIKKESV